MKNLIIAIALIFGINGFAQERNNSENSNAHYKCDSFTKVSPDKNIIELYDNAEFINDEIEIKNADKIVVNLITREIIANGQFEFKIKNGHVAVANNKRKNKILTYKIDENEASIE